MSSELNLDIKKLLKEIDTLPTSEALLKIKVVLSLTDFIHTMQATDFKVMFRLGSCCCDFESKYFKLLPPNSGYEIYLEKIKICPPLVEINRLVDDTIASLDIKDYNFLNARFTQDLDANLQLSLKENYFEYQNFLIKLEQKYLQQNIEKNNRTTAVVKI